LKPKSLGSGFGDKKGPASDDLNKTLNFKALNVASFVDFEHFLGPEFCVFYKLGLIFLDVDHAGSLQERLKSHFVWIGEVEKGFLEMFRKVDIKLILSLSV
jgi:hypothetical protein